MEIEKSKVSIQFLLFLRQSGNFFFFLFVPVGFADILRQRPFENMGFNGKTV